MSVVMAGRPYQWHEGEKKIQKILKLAGSEARERASWVLPFMPPQHMNFFANLQYFVLGTLDGHGRPWASVVTGQRGFIRTVNQNYLAMVTDLSEGDPILETLEEGLTVDEGSRVVAGLGIDLTNRRRNKVAGRISRDMVRIDGKELQVIITADESLGNCPKYITIRDVKYQKRDGVIKYHVPEMSGGSLPQEALEMIEQADAVFLAARHLAHNAKEINDMDVNHRGGNPGFVRVESDGRTLILPDYSGNLFYSTLGSIESDRLAGLTFANYQTGDILYTTGQAENLYGADADSVMPHTKLITRVHVTGFTLVQGGLNLASTEAHHSPYNPPVRYLASELHKLGKLAQETRQEINLVDVKQETRDISTFTFELTNNTTVDILPGQHAILDFSAENMNGYRHMADENPQSLNDDYIRSWTISSVPEIDAEGGYTATSRFSCTIKNKYGGAISPMLHRWARNRRHAPELHIKFIGAEGDFTCFDDHHRLKQSKLLFIAGGVGITPFMCMLEVLRKRNINADVVFLFSARGEEAQLARGFVDAGIDTRIFDTERDGTTQPVGEIEGVKRRMGYEDISGVPDLTERGVYLCGPTGFMNAIKGYLEKAGVNSGDVYIESFAF